MTSIVLARLNIIYLLMMTAVFIQHARSDGGFIGSCHSAGQVGQSLIATCRRDDGSEGISSINLNQCVANDNGNLACRRNGGFGASCGSIEISGQWHRAICTNRRASLDLNQCIGNHNGVLAC